MKLKSRFLLLIYLVRSFHVPTCWRSSYSWKMRNPSLKVDALESYLGNHSLSFSKNKFTGFLYRAGVLSSKGHPFWIFPIETWEPRNNITGPSQLRVREGLVVSKTSRPRHRYSFPVGLKICAIQWDPPIWGK